MAMHGYVFDERVPDALREIIVANIGVFEDPIVTADKHVMIACESTQLAEKLAPMGLIPTTITVSEIPIISFVEVVPASISDTPLDEGNEIIIKSWPIIVKDIKFQANEVANALWKHILAEEERLCVYLERPINLYAPKDQMLGV